MTRKAAITFGGILILVLMTIGCGGGGGTIIPEDTTPPPNNNPGDNPPADNPPVNPGPDEPALGRHLWGMWNVNFNESDQSVNVTPVDGIEGYFTGVEPELVAESEDAVDVEVNYYDPATRVLDLEVNVVNTHEDSAYDVRAVVYTDDAGHEVKNPEGWTEAFDIPGGRDVNPFKFFADDEAGRKIVPEAAYEEDYAVSLPVGGENSAISIAIDGSWYEKQTEPVYALRNFHQTEMYDDDDTFSEIFVDLEDPHGTINRVTIEAGEITGEQVTELSRYSGDTWHAVVKNKNQMPVGDYEVKVSASVVGSSAVAIHDYVPLRIVKDHGWVRTWGGVYGGDIDAPVLGDRARDVAVDNLGNVLVTGMFNDIADFDPGLGEDVRVSIGDFDIYLAKYDSGGNLMWVNTWGGPSGEFGDSVAADGAGNIYVVGRFIGTVDFDPGPGTDIRSADGKDVFLSMFYPDGRFRGVFTWGGPGDDYGYAIAIDKNSNVYVGGNFEGTCDFNPGSGTDFHTADNGDAYIVKFDNNGFFQWARTWGSTGWDFVESLDVDYYNNVYVAGNAAGSLDLDPGLYTDWKYTKGCSDVFLMRFTSAGAYYWGVTFGGEGWDYGYAVAASDYGDGIYIAGEFQYKVDFDPGWSKKEVEVGYEHYAYLSKFNSWGDFMWVRTQGGVVIPWQPPPCEPILDLAIDRDGNVFATGWYEGGVEFPGGYILESQGGRDGFVAKYTSSGGCQWVTNIGGPSRDEGYGVAVDDRGNVYAAGFFWDTVDFNPGEGTTNRTSNGYDDVWLIKFMSDGLW